MSENNFSHQAEEKNTSEPLVEIPSPTEQLRALVESEEFRKEGIYERETHSKKGEHIFLVFNPHSTESIDARCFIQVYLPNLPKNDPSRLEEYKWTVEQSPSDLYPGKTERIEEILALFEPVIEKQSG